MKTKLNLKAIFADIKDQYSDYKVAMEEYASALETAQDAREAADKERAHLNELVSETADDFREILKLLEMLESECEDELAELPDAEPVDDFAKTTLGHKVEEN